MRGMHPRRGRRQPNVALVILALQMAQIGFTRIPPVTLATIASQVAIYLRLFDIKWPSIMDVCISPVTVWYREGYTRLILGAFFHVDEWHLYYNMASFLWKGMTLEKRLGSGYFLYTLAVFTILCNTLTVALAMLAEHLLHDPSYLSQCAVGFSGVIFALKVITTHMLPPGTQHVLGFIPVNSRLACWVELVVIQLLVPRASFLGHLAGILVGTAYCKGPLKVLMNMFIVSPPSYTYVSAPSGRTHTSGRDEGTSFAGSGYTSGYSAHNSTQEPGHRYYTRSQASTPESEDYTGGLSEEDQVQRAMYESMRDTNRNSDRRMPTAPPDEDNVNQYRPPPPTYPGRAGNHDNSVNYSDSADNYTGTGASGTQPQKRPGKLYPDISNLSDEGERSRGQQGSNLDQDELRRRRLARFS